jgi:hypothetical protein
MMLVLSQEHKTNQTKVAGLNDGTPNLQCNSVYCKRAHKAALYDACLLIVNTYNQTDMLDGYCIENCNGNVTAYDFMKYARNILNRIAEDTLQ